VGARDRVEEDPAVAEGVEAFAVRDLEQVVAGVPFAVDHEEADATLDQRPDFIHGPPRRRGSAAGTRAEPREPLPCALDAAVPLIPASEPAPERRVLEREPEVVTQCV